MFTRLDTPSLCFEQTASTPGDVETFYARVVAWGYSTGIWIEGFGRLYEALTPFKTMTVFSQAPQALINFFFFLSAKGALNRERSLNIKMI